MRRQGVVEEHRLIVLLPPYQKILCSATLTLEKKHAFAVRGGGGGYGAGRGLLAATTLSAPPDAIGRISTFFAFCLDPHHGGWYTLLIDKGQCASQLKGKPMNMTPKELAIELDTDAKTVRKFLRSLTTERAGKGGRWVIDADDLDTLKDRFAAYNSRRSTVLTIADFDTDTND